MIPASYCMKFQFQTLSFLISSWCTLKKNVSKYVRNPLTGLSNGVLWTMGESTFYHFTYTPLLLKCIWGKIIDVNRTILLQLPCELSLQPNLCTTYVCNVPTDPNQTFEGYACRLKIINYGQSCIPWSQAAWSVLVFQGSLPIATAKKHRFPWALKVRSHCR